MDQISDDSWGSIFSFIQIYELAANLRVNQLWNKNIKQSLTHRRTFIALREGIDLTLYGLARALEFFSDYCKKLNHIDLCLDIDYRYIPKILSNSLPFLKAIFLPEFNACAGWSCFNKNILNQLPLTLQILSISEPVDKEIMHFIGDRFKNLIGLSIKTDYEYPDDMKVHVDSISYMTKRCSNLIVLAIDTLYIDIDLIAINLPYCRYLYLPCIAQVHHHCNNLLLFEHRLVELNYGNVWFIDPSEFKIFAEKLTRLKRLAIVCPDDDEYIETIEILHDKDILPHLEELSLTSGRGDSQPAFEDSRKSCSILDELKQIRPKLTTYHFAINDIHFDFKSACHRAGLMNLR